MEAEIKFLDGLEVKKKLEDISDKQHNELIDLQRAVIFQKMKESFDYALRNGYNTFNFQVRLSDIKVRLLPEIEQELKDSHWHVYFYKERDIYLIGPSSDEPEETPS